ncbi:E3 ubiquitin-protein ligase RNF139 isoform X2 [Neomonachus schauinslandi]|uniref:E3 ubiquitin-protein ligase RNF139 isoform X2 n=1 Tax=Neomonachus schauinslandi TaxID=29088 RepID=A0A2Y9GYY5_NEOSC|nr:E3 ubiquitin-protein ligase RNF139 isoform X2 [Neomonachus schauinslandi]
MAAVGPPQQQVRMAHQQVWAALEVALRVPCLYIIDAIFNSYYDSSQSRFCIGLQIFLRLLDPETDWIIGPNSSLAFNINISTPLRWFLVGRRRSWNLAMASRLALTR